MDWLDRMNAALDYIEVNYPEWFPNSGYEQDEGPLQERSHETDRGTFIVAAWVPVKRRQKG